MKYEPCRYCGGTGKQINQADLGKHLRLLRIKAGISLRSMAKAMNISAPYLSDLERGRRYWNDRMAEYKLILKAVTDK